MRVGSIVVCLPVTISDCWKGKISWLPVMDENTPYMIREIHPSAEDINIIVVVFEEGIIGYNDNGIELAFPADYVREILPAENIFELIEELNYEMV